MEFFNHIKIIILFILINQIIRIVKNALVFPRYSVYQITCAFSVPVELKYRKLFFDWGFQMNYDLPWNESSFYNIPIWPGFPSIMSIKPSKRSINLSSDSIEKYFENNTETKYTNLNMHRNDLTAGELYSIIEDFLVQYGYDETCLLKSVCENAKHPFEISVGEENLIAEVLNFLLSPSIHEGFTKDEIDYQKAYENAEFYGYAGHDCDSIYPDCKIDILNLVTKVIHS